MRSMSEQTVHVDRLWPHPMPNVALDQAFADLGLPSRSPAERPWVGVNMVTSVDGRAQLGGGADGLGSRVDRRLMRLLRAGYDAIATGSGTVRATGFWPRLPADLADRRADRGRPPQPVSVVIAGSQPVPLERWRGEEIPRLLVVGSDNPQLPAPGIEMLRAPLPEPEPGWILEQLRGRGIGSVLLEGGPTTNAAFLAAGCLDELFWTVGPLLVGTAALPMIAPISGGSPWADAPLRGSLVSAYRNGDELFLRYRFG
jgi:riboflavin biosynthesis pyrimidine reductase